MFPFFVRCFFCFEKNTIYSLHTAAFMQALNFQLFFMEAASGQRTAAGFPRCALKILIDFVKYLCFNIYIRNDFQYFI